VEESEAPAGRLDRGQHVEHIEVLTHVHDTRLNGYGDHIGWLLSDEEPDALVRARPALWEPRGGNTRGHPAPERQTECAHAAASETRQCLERVWAAWMTTAVSRAEPYFFHEMMACPLIDTPEAGISMNGARLGCSSNAGRARIEHTASFLTRNALMKAITIIAGTLLFVPLATLAQAATLVGHWQLEETNITQGALDASGTSADGAYSAGSDPNVIGVPGFGSGAFFSGSNSFINIGAGSALNLQNDFSVMGWMNLSNTSGKHSMIGNPSWAVRSTGTAPQITTFGVKDYTGTSGTLVAGQWTHVAVTLDSNNDAQFYVNGNPAGFVTHSAPANSNTGDFAIGRRAPGNGSERMVGWIDDVRVYDGVLTQTEVQGIMTDFTTTATPLGQHLIRPIDATSSTAGSDLYTVRHLIDDSGLNGVATLTNLGSITHAGSGSSNSWVTTNPNGGGDYYLASNPGPDPVLTFDLGGLFELTDVVAWNYSVPGNAGMDFTIEFSAEGSPFGSPLMLTVPQAAGSAHVIPLGDTFLADTVRVTFTDNYFGSGAGGDRVGLNEIKFIGAEFVAPVAAVPEPATLIIATLGLLGMGWLGRRRRKRA
jgi:hypothetical protein